MKTLKYIAYSTLSTLGLFLLLNDKDTMWVNIIGLILLASGGLLYNRFESNDLTEYKNEFIPNNHENEFTK